MSVLLLLSLSVVNVIQLTSSQPTYDDIIQQGIDVIRCRDNEQMLYQLQQDVAALKAVIDQIGQKKGRLKSPPIRSSGNTDTPRDTKLTLMAK